MRLAVGDCCFGARWCVASADTMGRVHGGSCRRSSATVRSRYELCFDKPNDGVARAEYLSEPFYAIILEDRGALQPDGGGATARANSVCEEQGVFGAVLLRRGRRREYCLHKCRKRTSGFLAVYAGA